MCIKYFLCVICTELVKCKQTRKVASVSVYVAQSNKRFQTTFSTKSYIKMSHVNLILNHIGLM
jgi:hypothetical protein